MLNYEIYNDIAKRTGGDIYLGVVGPVRTGKSTFIKKFMETLVLENIEDPNKRARAIDELPQSADGKTIMTTEPKFVPNEAVKLNIGNMVANIRLIDCVGYLVDDAIGHKEGNKARLVSTPWSTTEMPFQQAAELGTSKVIREHSTIGILITTDGSITDIARSKYIDAEERVVRELKSIGKPFVIVLNTTNPNNPDTIKLAQTLEERYSVPVLTINVDKVTKEELSKILSTVLMEFPIACIDIDIPKWMRALPRDSEIISQLILTLNSETNMSKMRDYQQLCDILANNPNLSADYDVLVDSGCGKIKLTFHAKEGLFYSVLSELCERTIDDDFKLMLYVKKLGKSYKDYEKIRLAMDEVKETGYGVVQPTIDDMTLEEPELAKKGSQFGVRLKASAPSLHIVRVDVETEINPIIGSEQQSEDLVKYLMSEFENNKKGIWNTNMFGKPLSSLVREDINNKISNMPRDVQSKLRRTMSRIVNEGKGGVLCILL